MKVLVVVGGGIADAPLEEMNGRTPLEAAAIPSLDRIVSEGMGGGWISAPPGQMPAGDTALYSFLGYETRVPGGALDAAGMDIPLQEDEVAFRANFVCLRPGATNVVMFDPVGCGVSDEEGAQLVGYLEERLAADPGEEIRIHPIGGHRAVFTYRKAGIHLPERDLAAFSPPHEIMGETIEGHLPSAKSVRRLVHIVNDSQMILALHPGLREKAETSMFAANSLWLWGGGKAAELKPLSKAVGGRRVTFITRNPAILGLGRLGGAEVIRPAGEGSAMRSAMAEAARKALGRSDFVLLFLDDALSASERGDAGGKVAAIEALDADIIAPLLADPGAPCRFLVFADHIASTETRRAVPGPVPYAMADWKDGRLSPPAGRSGLMGLWEKLSKRSLSDSPPRAFSEHLSAITTTPRPMSGRALLGRLLAS